MERYFIIVIEELTGENNLGGLHQDFEQLKQNRQLVLENLKSLTAPAVFPINSPSLEWAVCVGKTQTMFRGAGLPQLQELLSSSFVADFPFEVWETKSFNHLNNHAVDIILQWNDCQEFWKSFNPSNSVKLFRSDAAAAEKDQVINPKLFWRGTMKMRDPENTSVYGQMENAELNYAFDKLDMLKSQIKNANPSTMLLLPSQQQQQRITFCPFLELVNAFNAQTVPFIFYSSAPSLTLSVESADSFWTTMDENVSFLFRLDYAPDEVELWEKEMRGAQSIHFLSHWADGELKLFVLKNAEQLQNLANVFVRSAVEASPIAWAAPTPPPKQSKGLSSSYLQLDRMDQEIRRLQLLALQTWMAEKGSIDSTTLDQLMDQVALAVVTKHRSRFTVNEEAEAGAECAEFTDGDMLKWRLEKKMTTIEADRAAASSRNLMQPTNGRIITVDVPQLLRCFNKKPTTASAIGRSPKKVRGGLLLGVVVEPSVTTNLKPSCNEDTVRTTSWPQSATLKYHGINYNLNVDDEKMEKQRAEYQDKWVPSDTASAVWCNPWSFGTWTTFQMSTRSRQPTPLAPAAATTTTATTPEVRTPRKNSQQQSRRLSLAQLRKSPRLLAKGAAVIRTTRRTPSKNKNNYNNNINAVSSSSASATAATSKDITFKQQLKAVIIKVLADQKIGTKDPLFRTCANKLSVICMALLKDSKTVVTPRQMYQVAKSQAKQVLQFVKP